MSNGKWKMEKSNLVAIYHVRTSVCIETSGVDMFDLEIKNKTIQDMFVWSY